MTDAYIGIDLTILSAASSADYSSLGMDLPVEFASFPKLVSCASAACSGGLDLILLAKEFLMRCDRSGGSMDAVRTMARLTDTGAAGFSAEVPTEAPKLAEAIGLLSQQRDGWGSIEISLDHSSDLRALTSFSTAAHDAGIHVSGRMSADDVLQMNLTELTALVDAVRLQTEDPHVARECRFALRSAAAEQGRSLDVLVDMGVVISGSAKAASERALLIEGIQQRPLFDGKAKAVGTVYDVADAVENWIGLGGADGIIFMPASLPTDLASIIRGVLPLLKARSEVK